MDSLSRLAVTSSGNGSRLASRSSSPFSLSLCRLDGLDLDPAVGGCFTLIRKQTRTIGIAVGRLDVVLRVCSLFSVLFLRVDSLCIKDRHCSGSQKCGQVP